MGHKQIYTFQNSSHKSVYKTFSQVSLQNQSLHKHKTYRHKHQNSDTYFRRVSAFNITPVKRAYKARTCWYHRPFRLIYRYQVKEKYFKKRSGQIQILYNCIVANTSAMWQQAAHTTYQLSSPSCLTRAIQKSLTLNEKYLRVFWRKKSQENGPLAEK